MGKLVNVDSLPMCAKRVLSKVPRQFSVNCSLAHPLARQCYAEPKNYLVERTRDRVENMHRAQKHRVSARPSPEGGLVRDDGHQVVQDGLAVDEGVELWVHAHRAEHAQRRYGVDGRDERSEHEDVCPGRKPAFLVCAHTKAP
jgi:hypothetical protein